MQQVGYGYAANGLFTTLSYPSGSVFTYLYDATGRLSQLKLERRTAHQRVVVEHQANCRCTLLPSWSRSLMQADIECIIRLEVSIGDCDLRRGWR